MDLIKKIAQQVAKEYHGTIVIASATLDTLYALRVTHT